jgi:4-amino-4-deoxy-L-arabinose transferase-like glycosyltransferase
LSREGRVVLGLGALFLGSRLFALTGMPAFLDETADVRWAVEIASGEKFLRPWNYGKGLSVFLNALLFPWAFDHYLWASRALAVGFGAVSFFVGIAAGRRLFDAKTGLVFGLLYVVCPFALFYDRLVLTDPPMAAFAALALLLSLRLHEAPSHGRALLLALALTAAVLTKATALLVAVIPLAALLLLGRVDSRRVRSFALALAATAVALFWPVQRFFATTSTVRLGVSHREADLVGRLTTNLPMAFTWLVTYWTLPLALLAVGGVLLDLRGRPRPVLFLAALVVVPVLGFAAISSLWFPRYLVFVTVPALLLAARGLVRLQERTPRWAQGLLLVGAIAPALAFDRDILFEPVRADLPDIDRAQFILGWPSGYGTEDTVAFVREELQHHPAGLTVVVHVHSRRTTWLALGLEFARDPRVELRDLDLNQPQNLDLLAAWAHTRPTLLVLSPVGAARARPEPLTWAHLGGLALRSYKPDGALCDEIYRLDPPAPEARSPSR